MRLTILFNLTVIKVSLLLVFSTINSSLAQEDIFNLVESKTWAKNQTNKGASLFSENYDNSSKSAFRGASREHTTTPPSGIFNKKEEKHPFRIGLIVPRTAFHSQYKTYQQRIKDTFNHIIQLSRHQHQKSASVSHGQVGNTVTSSSVASSHQPLDKKMSTPSCYSSSNILSQQQWSLPWPPSITFNQYFDIQKVYLVDLTQRSDAHEIIDSMCQKLINQNVSVIIYLENNQDQTVASLESRPENPQTHLNDNDNQSQSNLKPVKKESQPNLGTAVVDSEQVDVNTNKEQSSPLSRSHNQQTNSQAHFIMHLAHSAGVPTIAWSVTATLAQRPKKQRTLHLAPTVAHEAEAMLSIMQRYSWHSFSVVSTTLAGHEDFILALRQFMATYNSGQSSSSSGSSSSTAALKAPPSTRKNSSSNSTHPIRGLNSSNINGNAARGSGQESDFISNAHIGKTFKLLDVITIKKLTTFHIEEEMRKLTVSESRVILLYATKGEAIDILRAAKVLKLTKRSYAWIVAQSVIGPNENERAPMEFHPGLLGIHFSSNHERLLDELSRAITIIAHGLERFVRDKNALTSDKVQQTSNKIHDGQGVRRSRGGFKKEEELEKKKDLLLTPRPKESSLSGPSGSDKLDAVGFSDNEELSIRMDKTHHLTARRMANSSRSYRESRDSNSTLDSMTEYRKRLLSAYSTCSGPSNSLSEKRGDLLYEHFSKSSPYNVFDADGSLKDVELSVVNLDNERQWRRIGCFSQATLTIDDITWPEKSERPPSGTMEKFHLRAVFLEEPSFVNLADPDTETGECKTNRAVRCRYKVIHDLLSRGNRTLQTNAFITKSKRGLPKDANRSLLDKGEVENEDQVIQILPFKDAFTEGSEFEYKCCSGFCIDLMEKLATDLKFSYELYRVPDGFWGILENNTWNGLIGEIVNGKADVTVGPTKINSDRQRAVDFTVPFLDTGISILVAKQTGVIAKLAFLEPFDTLAWVMFICVGIPIAAISIFYFEWLSPNGFYAKNNYRLYLGCSGTRGSGRQKVSQKGHAERDHQKFSFCRTLWLVITILFGSAAHIDSPKGYTARFMSNVWATFAVVFLAVYTANLAAFMITREEYLELSGISDSKLAYPYHRHPPLKFGTITGGNTHAVLSANKPNLYNYMRSFNRPSVEDGVDAVKTGQLDAFVYDALVLDYMASQDPECKLVNVGSWYSMTGYALAFPKESRYYDKFNMKMLEYRKNGELDRLRRFWLQGLCKPGLNRHSISKPLDLSQFMSAFLLLGAGILFSIFILVLEHLYIMYVRDRLMRSKYRKQLIKFLYPFSLSLAQTLTLPDDGEEDLDVPSTYQELEKLDNRPKSFELDNHFLVGIRNHQQEETQDLTSTTNFKSLQAKSLALQRKQFAGVSTTNETFSKEQNVEFMLLKALEQYDNVKRARQRGHVPFGRAEDLGSDSESDRSELRQVKWLVGELQTKLQHLLMIKNREGQCQLELKLTSCESTMIKSYITEQIVNDDDDIPKTPSPEHPPSNFNEVSRLAPTTNSPAQVVFQKLPEKKVFESRKKIAKCSTTSDLHGATIKRRLLTVSGCESKIEPLMHKESNVGEESVYQSRRLTH